MDALLWDVLQIFWKICYKESIILDLHIDKNVTSFLSLIAFNKFGVLLRLI